MLNEIIKIIDKDGIEKNATWREILEKPDNFAAVPTHDPFLFIPLVMLATTVNKRAQTLGLTVPEYLSKFNLWTATGGPLSRLQNAPAATKGSKQICLKSWKAPYEIKHDKSTIPNFFHHTNPAEFPLATRIFIASIITSNINPINCQRSPWLDGVSIPIGLNTLSDTINIIGKTINQSTKPIWEYADYVDYCGSCNKHLKLEYSYELILLPMFDFVGTNLFRISTEHIKVKDIKLHKKTDTPYTHVFMESHGGQGSITTWYMETVFCGKLKSRINYNYYNTIKKINDLHDKKANTQNKNSLFKLLSDLNENAPEILRGIECSADCGRFTTTVDEIIKDDAAIKMYRDGNWIGLSRRHDILTKDLQLVKLILAQYIKAGRTQNIEFKNITKFVSIIGRLEMLGQICFLYGVSPGLCFIIYKNWNLMRCLLMDFQLINNPLTNKQKLRL